MDSQGGEPQRIRLESWKQIAAFFGRTVVTVQRWEAREGLPVHRHAHAKRGTIFAYADELEAWRGARTRTRRTASPVVFPEADFQEPAASFPLPQDAVATEHTRRRTFAISLALAAGSLLVAGLTWQRTRHRTR